MRKSTRFMLAIPLLSIFAAASVSAFAEDAKKPGHATSGIKTHGSSKSFSAGSGQKGDIGRPADVVNGAVNGAVGGAINSAVGGLLGAFGPR